VTANLKTLGSPVLQPALPAILHTLHSDMAAVRALNDDEVFNEMKKMVCICFDYVSRTPRNMLTMEILQSLHALCK
jgi:hypothetical protein